MESKYVNQEEVALLKQLGEKLAKNELTVGTAESCTGGRIACLLSSLPEISDHLIGGIVSYSEEIKKKLLGVAADDIEKYGVVSQPVAEQMAFGACQMLECACATATTGFAGPDGGTPENPVGTVWIAAVVQGKVISECFHFEGERQEVVIQSAYKALEMLTHMLG